MAGLNADTQLVVVGRGLTAERLIASARERGKRVTSFNVAGPGNEMTSDPYADFGDTLSVAQTIVFALPAPDLAVAVEWFGPHARGDQTVFTACFCLAEPFELPHEIVRNQSCIRKIGVIGRRLQIPITQDFETGFVSVASRFTEVGQTFRELFGSRHLTVATTRDLVGLEILNGFSSLVELAVASSASWALFPSLENLLRLYALADAARLSLRLGADPATFLGLTGLAQLIPSALDSRDPSTDVARQQQTARAIAGRAAQVGVDLPFVRTVRMAIDNPEHAKEAFMLLFDLPVNLHG
jgi:hypothetical protein